MAINKLKKINVRSPYYISVAKPVSEGGEGDEPDVAPTEPVDREQSIVCGDNQQVGVDVGRRVYKISLAGRVLGDYTIALTGITVPIKYRIGHSDNLPAFSIAGSDAYTEEFRTATGHDGSSLSSDSSVSVNATYTSTQSDIDTYGEEIILEIQQPLITEGYSFALSCPSFIPETNSSGNVLVISVIRTRNTGFSQHSITVNGTSVEDLPSSRQYAANRYVFDTSSPNISTERDSGASGFHSRQSVGFATSFTAGEIVVGSFGGYGAINAVYKSPAIIRGSATNEITITNDAIGFDQHFRVLVSRQPTETISGVTYIRGSYDGVDAQAIISEFSLEKDETFTMTFTGSNTEELATGLAYKTIFAAGEGELGEENVDIQSSLFTIQKL